ncbi:MAG: FAD-binding oxidoreductase [Pseudomonadota bacterium]
MVIENCKQELRDAIGTEKVRDDNVCMTTYAMDAAPIFRKPDLVVLPESAEDVRKVLPIANKYRLAVTVMATGINVVGLTVPSEHGMVLDMRRMNKIIEINTDSGYATIEPGVTFEQFTNALRKVGFRCQVCTTHPSASVAANYMMGPSGTFCTRHLDPMIDLEVVFPDGSITNTGSAHFPGSGPHRRYGSGPDLTGLFALGHGTMGIVTKSSVRIYPKTEGNALPMATFPSFEASIRFSQDVVLNNIAEHIIVYSWRMWLDAYAKGSTTFKEPPKGMPYNAVTMRLAGYPGTVETNLKIIEKVAQKYGGTLHSEEEAAKMMLYYRDFQQWYFDSKTLQITPARLEQLSSAARPGTETDEMGLYIAWVVNATPKDVIECEKWAMQKIEDIGLGVPAYYSQPYDYGRSWFLRIFIYPDALDPAVMQKVAATFTGMFDEALARYHATPYRARGFGAVPWLHGTGEFRNYVKKLKAAVDPNNILNPMMLGQ